MDEYDLEMEELGAELGYEDEPEIDEDDGEDPDDYRAGLDLPEPEESAGLPEGCHLSLVLEGEDP